MGKKSKNLKILAEYTERIKNGDTDAVYEYFAPEFSSHVAKRVAPESSGFDIRLGEVMFWQESANAFPDREFVIEKIWEIDDEEIVIVNWTVTGTHSGGSYFGVPASGKKVEINGTGIVRFENGRIVAGLHNFRFHDSPLRCLQRIEAATPPQESITLERNKMLLPALKLPDFYLSSVTKF